MCSCGNKCHKIGSKCIQLQRLMSVIIEMDQIAWCFRQAFIGGAFNINCPAIKPDAVHELQSHFR